MPWRVMGHAENLVQGLEIGQEALEQPQPKFVSLVPIENWSYRFGQRTAPKLPVKYVWIRLYTSHIAHLRIAAMKSSHIMKSEFHDKRNGFYFNFQLGWIVTRFRLRPYSRIRVRGISRESEDNFIQVRSHSRIPCLARLLEHNQPAALLKRITAANHAVELIQVGQICRIWDWGIRVIVQLMMVVVLSIIDVEVFNWAPFVSDTGLELKRIW